MLNRLPEFVDPRKLAHVGQTLAGRIAVKRMQRLVSAVNRADEWVDTELEFGRDQQGIACVRGRATVKVELLCQRCLEPVEVLLQPEISLGVVRSEEQTAQLPAAYEPLIVGDEPVSLAALVEDELILALPTVAIHDAQACHASAEGEEAGDETESSSKPNPFAVLETLKKHGKSE
jgi:uncharacterized protein